MLLGLVLALLAIGAACLIAATGPCPPATGRKASRPRRTRKA